MARVASKLRKSNGASHHRKRGAECSTPSVQPDVHGRDAAEVIVGAKVEVDGIVALTQVRVASGVASTSKSFRLWLKLKGLV
jgi:hypothetical protein